MLINCSLYKDGIKQKNLTIDEISQWAGKQDHVLWAAFNNVDDALLDKIQGIFKLNELAVEDTGQPVDFAEQNQIPRIVEYQNTIFIMANLLEYKNNQIEAGEMTLFVGSNYILSFRKNSEHRFTNVRDRCEREPDLLKMGPGYILYAILDEIVDRYFPLLNRIEDEMAMIEKEIFTKKDTKKLIEKLFQLKTQTTDLRHATIPLSEVLGKLHGGRVPTVCMNVQDYFNDIHNHLIRINKSIENFRDGITTSVQVSLALATIEKSETTKKLAAWAAIFGVCTTGVGIWGMNFKHMPELDWQYGYPLSLLIIFGAAYYVYRKFKKSGWL
jgi:magnesium transporter